jgi:enoyl-CoA hydratase
MSDDEAVKVTRRGDVLEIILSRPALLNRIDEPAHNELIAVFRALEFDATVRSVVLGAEGRVFSAGGDLAELRVLNVDPVARTRLIAQARALFAALIDAPVPVVVAMQGDAHGLGANIVLACDAVVAWRGAKLSDAHVRVGLVAGDGGCVVWPAAFGSLRARRHLLTGDPIDAEQAFALGAVTDLVDRPEDVLPAARALADRIAALAPMAVRGTKRALNNVLKQRAGEVFEFALALETETLASADAMEAVEAFLGRRPPRFVGV